MRDLFVVGHRGAGNLEPENTIRSIERAIDLGVDAVEVDARRSKDGELVVIHDSWVDRTTDGKGRVKNLTLSQLRTLDAGKGEKIPTLDEVLQAVRGKIELELEIKEPETVPDVLEALKRKKMLAKTTLVSFFHGTLKEARELVPRSRCGIIYLCSPADPSIPVKLALDAEAQVLITQRNYLSKKIVSDAHRHSIEVSASIVNNENDLKDVAALGVDWVSSDYPDKILEAMGR